MDKYSKSDVENIQNGYRCLFPHISEELERFWYPGDNYDWLCLSSRFHSGPTYEAFCTLDKKLNQIDRSQSPKEIGKRLADFAREHGTGYSIGLNPWADYFMHMEGRNGNFQEVMVIVAYNWYPLVTTNNVPLNSPLHKDNPIKFLNGKYKFAFKPFFDCESPFLIFFTNIFPYLMEAGEPATKGLSKDQKKFVGGNKGMMKGLELTIEAIKPSIKVKGLITWGASAWNILRRKAGDKFSKMTLTKLVNALQEKLRENPSKVAEAFPKFKVKSRCIPWLPYFHPVARELTTLSCREEYRTDYLELVKALLKHY